MAEPRVAEAGGGGIEAGSEAVGGTKAGSKIDADPRMTAGQRIVVAGHGVPPPTQVTLLRDIS